MPTPKSRAARPPVKSRPLKPAVATRRMKPDLVRAHAVLRSVADRHADEGPFAPTGRETFIARPAATGLAVRARTALESLGFQVVGEGAGSITIEGAPELFRQVFEAKLSRTRTSATGRAAGQVIPKRGWRFNSPVTVPAGLRDLIDAIALPQPKVISR